MARPTLPELSPWKRHPLTIPPDSARAWARLVIWESWMGMLLGGAVDLGTRLIVTARANIVTVYDYMPCYATPPIAMPCERVVYTAGHLYMLFNAWCGILLMVVAAWPLWELWTAVAPKPITDDFLKLLDDSFGCNWRSLRTWPWARLGWAYGFTLIGAVLAVGAAGLISSAMSSSAMAKAPAAHVETSQRFRVAP